jgi:hypothetical protein
MRGIGALQLVVMLLYGAQLGASDVGIVDDRAGVYAKEAHMAGADDIGVLKELTGAAYERARDALLESPDLDSQLAATPAHQGDWRDTITRRILDGWRRHGSLYRVVLAELDAVDVEHESRKITGITGVAERFAFWAKTEPQADILPLCWEVLLKHGGEWPDWKLVVFLFIVAAVPAPESVDPVIAFLEGIDDVLLQDAAGQTLRKLPQDAVEPRVQRALAKHGHIVDVLRRVAERLR